MIIIGNRNFHCNLSSHSTETLHDAEAWGPIAIRVNIASDFPQISPVVVQADSSAFEASALSSFWH